MPPEMLFTSAEPPAKALPIARGIGDNSEHSVHDLEPKRPVGIFSKAEDQGHLLHLPALYQQLFSKNDISIHLCISSQEQSEAHQLVYERYKWRGYHKALQQNAAPNTYNYFTFNAFLAQQLVGTCSLRFEQDNGPKLQARELFSSQLDAIASNPHRLCEFSRLAVESSAHSQSVLAGLFLAAHCLAKELFNYSYFVMEVNPRHVRFYERLVGASVLSDVRMHPGVGAPAVLMGNILDIVGQYQASFAAYKKLMEGTPTHAQRILDSIQTQHPQFRLPRSIYSLGYDMEVMKECKGNLYKLLQLAHCGLLQKEV